MSCCLEKTCDHHHILTFTNQRNSSIVSFPTCLHPSYPLSSCLLKSLFLSLCLLLSDCQMTSNFTAIVGSLLSCSCDVLDCEKNMCTHFLLAVFLYPLFVTFTQVQDMFSAYVSTDCNYVCSCFGLHPRVDARQGKVSLLTCCLRESMFCLSDIRPSLFIA